MDEQKQCPCDESLREHSCDSMCEHYPVLMEKAGQETLKESTRTKTILVIKALEKLKPTDEGVELNEGYEFETNGALPEIADGIAKMAVEIDKMQEIGEAGGAYFLGLILEYYKKIKES